MGAGERLKAPGESGMITPLSARPETTCGAGVSPAHAAGTAAPQKSRVNAGQLLSQTRLAAKEVWAKPENLNNYLTLAILRLRFARQNSL